MKGRKLKMSEQNRLNIIKNVINNKYTKKMAAEMANVTIRTINYWINKYNKLGYAAFIHKNTGRISPRKYSDEFSELIISLYREYYSGFNYQFFREFLQKNHEIDVSYNYLRNLLLVNNCFSEKLHRKTKKEIRKRMDITLAEVSIKKYEEEEYKRSILSLERSHPMQNRKQFFGERVQADASQHFWVEGVKWQLHGFIDDSTGMIIALYFAKEETLQAYYECTKMMFHKFGTPKEILTDRRTVFWSPKEKESDMHSDSMTQYGFMCSNLGIKLTTTSIPQTKGRIERLWGTLQDRLTKLLKMNNIKTIEDANLYLVEHFIDEYNAKFALQLDDNKNAFITLENDTDINLILSRRFERKVNNGGAIKYMNKYYIPYSKGVPLVFKTGQSLFIVETFDGNLIANSYSEWFQLVEVDQISTRRDLYKEKEELKTAPPKKSNDKWKYTNWLFYKKRKNSNLGNFN